MSAPTKIGIATIGVVVVVGTILLLNRDGGQTACTTEAKMCADGSAVGRAGPQCQFDPCPEELVTLYYYNSALDTDASGAIACSEKGLVGVKRQIPDTTTRLNATIRALLAGELTAEERSQGITTEFPLEGVNFFGSSLDRGTLSLTFADPNHKTSGGSCRVNILRAQIEKTAKQFPGVTNVLLTPKELFQP